MSGRIEVICGGMFSGKTEELLRRVKRFKLAKITVSAFKPAIDDRYHATQIVTHEGDALEAVAVKLANEILVKEDLAPVVAIDEAQFFDNSLVQVVEALAFSGKHVILAGLDMDSRGNPFGPMPKLMAISDVVTKLHAVCQTCGQEAGFSFRKVSADDGVLVGGEETYDPLCRSCYGRVMQASVCGNCASCNCDKEDV